MSRGPPSRRALAEAIPIAHQRGIFQVAGRGPENLYDFTIVSAIPVAFVRVTYCSRIHAPVAELLMEFQDELHQLRMVTRHDAISRELWLRSRHGTWRFFCLTSNCLIELGRTASHSPGKPQLCSKADRGP
ncbi:MAG: hypothetical protein WC620_11840 [Methanoregula sp.]|jgi:hypothetical protein